MMLIIKAMMMITVMNSFFCKAYLSGKLSLLFLYVEVLQWCLWWWEKSFLEEGYISYWGQTDRHQMIFTACGWNQCGRGDHDDISRSFFIFLSRKMLSILKDFFCRMNWLQRTYNDCKPNVFRGDDKRVIMKIWRYFLRLSWPASNHLHCLWLKSVWKKRPRFLQCSHTLHPFHLPSHSSHLPKHPTWSSHLPYLNPSAFHSHIFAHILVNWTFELVSPLMKSLLRSTIHFSIHTLHTPPSSILLCNRVINLARAYHKRNLKVNVKARSNSLNVWQVSKSKSGTCQCQGELPLDSSLA